MSTFCGKIEEIPDISVDRFDGDNLHSSVYFLSHCHTDHMVGLGNLDIQRKDVYLYASSVSLNILKHKFPHFQYKLKELTIDTPTLITFPNNSKRTLTVTTIPAGHCPGSVMFLFETDKNILYTGDYRVQLNDLLKFKAFYSLGHVKKIHKMYLDTTFFHKSYNTFPTRKETAKQLCKIIQDWISQSEKHIAKLILSAKYGSEYLFTEISTAVGLPIHVQNEVYKMYKCVPELDSCVTLSSNVTQIHSSCGSYYNDICLKSSDYAVLSIKPSALCFRGSNFENGICIDQGGVIKVCYSCHASFQEIKDFILFLKPLEIEPCVIWSPKEEGQLRAQIDAIISGYQKNKQTNFEESNSCDTVEGVFHLSSPDNEFQVNNNILDSPPRSAIKRKREWLNKSDNIL